jgi:uncharacterized repeat protein (TIGR03803 family)
MCHLLTKLCAILLLNAATVISAPAQTFTSLDSFDSTDGANPSLMTLAQGPDGNFYGTTFYGAPNATCKGGGCGAIFRVGASGTLVKLHSFCQQTKCPDGQSPYAGMVLAADGNFYGTTFFGGSGSCGGGCGTLFKITPEGTFTTVHSFDKTDGWAPYAQLLLAADGNLYGTTYQGGTNDLGTLYKITRSGKLATLHSFDGTDGSYPYAGVVQGVDGNFYGTTFYGGSSTCANGCGTVYKITPSGTLTTIHRFDSTTGYYPWGGVVQGSDRNLYGTTYQGGSSCKGGCGTVYKVTPGGAFTTLYNFAGPDGSYPETSLVRGTDGNFYGTTGQGGANGNTGTVFEITPAGTLTTLHSFDVTDGSGVSNGLLQGTDGNFYGTTTYGGSDKACVGYCGTVFSISVGLDPFVETLPTSGKVGAVVKILGTNLTGTTAVEFNGTAATFTVVSNTEITSKVPTGATTGEVEVVTPGGTRKSNVAFRVP